jgi:hypothetical protein
MIANVIIGIVYIITVVSMSILTTVRLNDDQSFYFRLLTYLLVSGIFGVFVITCNPEIHSKQEYYHEMYTIKNGIDKDTIIINKKY